MKLLFFLSKKILYSFTLSTSLIWDAWTKLLAKSLRKEKKNLQINILFIKEYKNTCHYSRYVKQSLWKKSSISSYFDQRRITRISLRKEPWKRWTSPWEFHKFQCHLSVSMPLSFCFSFLFFPCNENIFFNSIETLCMALPLLSRYLDFYS